MRILMTDYSLFFLPPLSPLSLSFSSSPARFAALPAAPPPAEQPGPRPARLRRGAGNPPVVSRQAVDRGALTGGRTSAAPAGAPW